MISENIIQKSYLKVNFDINLKLQHKDCPKSRLNAFNVWPEFYPLEKSSDFSWQKIYKCSICGLEIVASLNTSEKTSEKTQ